MVSSLKGLLLAATVLLVGFYYLLLQFVGRVLLLADTVADVFFEGFYYLLYLSLWVSSFA